MGVCVCGWVRACVCEIISVWLKQLMEVENLLKYIPNFLYDHCYESLKVENLLKYNPALLYGCSLLRNSTFRGFCVNWTQRLSMPAQYKNIYC